MLWLLASLLFLHPVVADVGRLHRLDNFLLLRDELFLFLKLLIPTSFLPIPDSDSSSTSHLHSPYLVSGQILNLRYDLVVDGLSIGVNLFPNKRKHFAPFSLDPISDTIVAGTLEVE